MLTLEAIENVLSAQIKEQALPKEIKNPKQLLQKWSYFSNQVPRLLGSVLSRVKNPDIHCLFAKTIYGECGSGKKTKVHGRLFTKLTNNSPDLDFIAQSVEPELEQIFEEALAHVSQMSQDESIGFIVGLEAPAYDILDILKKALVLVGVTEEVVTRSEYMLIHEEVEKEHQESGHEAMEIAIKNGSDLNQINQGGKYAVIFWEKWWN